MRWLPILSSNPEVGPEVTGEERSDEVAEKHDTLGVTFPTRLLPFRVTRGDGNGAHDLIR